MNYLSPLACGRSHGWRLLLLAVLAVPAVLATNLTAATAMTEDRYLGYTGIAAERHSMKFLYGEQHVLRYHGDQLVERVVLYTCRDGTAFARKTASYVDSLAPDFLLEDASNGLRQGIRRAGSDRAVFFRNDRRAAERVGPLPDAPGLVADAGFDEFIRANWQSLMSGKSQVMRFVVPSRLDAMGFELRHVRTDHSDGVPIEVFRLSLAGVLGWVAPGIEVAYGTADHVLMHYDGVSDLRDALGSNLQAAVSFRARDRVSSDADRMSSARQTPLTACQ